MSRRASFRRAARDDVRAARDWYEEQHPGLGAAFVQRLEACIAKIERNPEIAPVVDEETRRAQLRRFPYVVYYELLDNDDIAPALWLDRMALVRPELSRIARVRSASEMIRSGVTPADLAICQLPPVSGDRWLALPSNGPPSTAEVALMTVTNGPVNFAKPIAGFFCDAWMETIPSRDEVTGIAFQFDAPGARAPQAILLAVPGRQDAAWSVDALLESITEAHDLARVRAASPRQLGWLGTVLPALYLPDSISPDVPGVDLRGLVAANAVINSQRETIIGKG